MVDFNRMLSPSSRISLSRERDLLREDLLRDGEVKPASDIAISLINAARVVKIALMSAGKYESDVSRQTYNERLLAAVIPELVIRVNPTIQLSDDEKADVGIIETYGNESLPLSGRSNEDLLRYVKNCIAWSSTDTIIMKDLLFSPTANHKTPRTDAFATIKNALSLLFNDERNGNAMIEVARGLSPETADEVFGTQSRFQPERLMRGDKTYNDQKFFVVKDTGGSSRLISAHEHQEDAENHLEILSDIISLGHEEALELHSGDADIVRKLRNDCNAVKDRDVIESIRLTDADDCTITGFLMTSPDIRFSEIENEWSPDKT